MIRTPIDVTNMIPMTRESAIQLVSLADTFSSRIVFKADNVIINGKSMLGLMTLHQAEYAPTVMECEGDDEKEASEAMQALLNSYKKVDKL